MSKEEECVLDDVGVWLRGGRLIMVSQLAPFHFHLIPKKVDRARILRIDSMIENTTTFACAHVGLCNLEIPQDPHDHLCPSNLLVQFLQLRPAAP